MCKSMLPFSVCFIMNARKSIVAGVAGMKGKKNGSACSPLL